MSRRALDVSALPTIVYGPRATIWWGVLGLIAIEGAALAIVGVAVGAWLYLPGLGVLLLGAGALLLERRRA
jgi:hypothetical protein